MLPIGVDVHGEPMKVPLNRMPHLLIAGSTGSGKSIVLHVLITALCKQMSPEMMRLVLIDPKRVELVAFAKDKHLDGKVIYEYDATARKLMSLVKEMEERYIKLEKTLKRDIGEYNETAKEKMPYIVTVIDEFADLMLRSKIEEKKNGATSYRSRTKAWMHKELKKRAGKRGEFFIKNDDTGELDKHTVHPIGHYDKDMLADILELLDMQDEMKSGDVNIEVMIIRLAQMGRAVGIHLILATQRPSVDVITGLIKANFPTRIALTTSSATDSMVILGEAGAEKLNGKGDMLFMHPESNGKVRLQGFMKD